MVTKLIGPLDVIDRSYASPLKTLRVIHEINHKDLEKVPSAVPGYAAASAAES